MVMYHKILKGKTRKRGSSKQKYDHIFRSDVSTKQIYP